MPTLEEETQERNGLKGDGGELFGISSDWGTLGPLGGDTQQITGLKLRKKELELQIWDLSALR